MPSFHRWNLKIEIVYELIYDLNMIEVTINFTRLSEYSKCLAKHPIAVFILT